MISKELRSLCFKILLLSEVSSELHIIHLSEWNCGFGSSASWSYEVGNWNRFV